MNCEIIQTHCLTHGEERSMKRMTVLTVPTFLVLPCVAEIRRLIFSMTPADCYAACGRRTSSAVLLLLVALLPGLKGAHAQTNWTHSESGAKVSGHAEQTGLPEHDFRCSTCEYLHHQYERIRARKKPIVDTSFVPPDFWQQTGKGAYHPLNVHNWPSRYYEVSETRTDSNGNGLRECRLKIDFSQFKTDGAYTDQEVLEFEDELRRCLDMWNDILQHVGLEFLEVSDDNYHVLFEATLSSFEDNKAIGRATLFGAWYGDSPVFRLRSNYESFAALVHLADEGAASAAFRGPPGNPYIYVYHRGAFGGIPISNTILHEIGHLVGLIHPWAALWNSRSGKDNEYLLDWLAWPRIDIEPPRAVSFTLAGESFLASGWSRGYINSFMTYDRGNWYCLYPDIPPPIKAFLAHYYGRYNPSRAQYLLDSAIREHNSLSWLAQGRCIQEVEPNDQVSESMRIRLGTPVLGALSSFDRTKTTMEETFSDVQDCYTFQVIDSDRGREFSCEVSVGSTLYENYHCTTKDGREYNGTVVLELYDNQKHLLVASDAEEFPEFVYTPETAGLYYVVVKRPETHPHAVTRDYLLSVVFTDGQASNAPTYTPTQTPVAIRTPIPIDLGVERAYLVIDDGGDSYDDDVEITTPQVNQSVRFIARVKNLGSYTMQTSCVEVYLDGVLFTQWTKSYELKSGLWQRWRTTPWSTSVGGTHTVEWIFSVEGDVNPLNNSMSLQFDVLGPMPTPTSTKTPLPLTPTFTPTVTPTPTLTRTRSLPTTLTPVPELTLERVFTLDTADEFTEYPGGFGDEAAGSVLVGGIPSGGDGFTDGQGAMIVTAPGELELLMFPTLEVGDNVVLIRASVQSTGGGAAVALAVLDGSMDGSIATNIPADSAIFRDKYRRMVLVYDPPGTTIVPVLQVANLPGEQALSVYLDNVEIYLLPRGVSVASDLLYGDTTAPRETRTPPPTAGPIRTPTETPRITPTPTRTPGFGFTGETITIPISGLHRGAMLLEMVQVPRGTFTMGSPNTERGRVEWEGPQHEVTIRQAFYLGKYEVTQAQWEAVMGSNPAGFAGTDWPVENVSWIDCQTFINKLNLMGLGTFRFPTEAEWEYACRAGTSTRFSFGDALECANEGEVYCALADGYMWWKGNNVNPYYARLYDDIKCGWEAEAIKIRTFWRNEEARAYGDLVSRGLSGTTLVATMRAQMVRNMNEDLASLNDSYRRLILQYEIELGVDFANLRFTQKVGSRLPNVWGLYDMHGNVTEWCQDWYYLYRSSPQVDPLPQLEPTENPRCVVRGGHWGSDLQNCRSAFRNGREPDTRRDYVGFRLVREYP